MGGKHDARRLIKYPIRKPQFGTVDKAELTLYGKRMRPLVALRMQRRAPRDITARIIPLKASPNKLLIDRVVGDAKTLQIFLYRDRPDWVCVAYRGDFIQFPYELVSTVRRGLRKYLISYKVLLCGGANRKLKSYRERGKKLAAERKAGAVVKNA